MATDTILTYKGNCHCGRYPFEIDVPETKGAICCDCTMCVKKGYLWIVPKADAFRVVRDDSRLSEFESASLRDRFCNYCGTGVTGEHVDGPMSGQFAVNLRAFQGITPFNLESNLVMKHTYEPERKVETLVKSRMANGQGHETASCYYGKVQAELLFPLAEGEIKEDNCSACVRIAYIGVYPTRDQVRISGRNETFEYRHGRGFGGAAYCKHCGVHIYGNVYGPDPSVFDKLPPERREVVLKIYHKNMSLQPVNVRSIEGVDLSTIHIERSDEGTEGYVLDD